MLQIYLIKGKNSKKKSSKKSNKKCPARINVSDITFLWIAYSQPRRVNRQLIFYIFSIINAEAPPPPLQIAAIPTEPDFLCKTLFNVVKIRAPDAPSG